MNKRKILGYVIFLLLSIMIFVQISSADLVNIQISDNYYHVWGLVKDYKDQQVIYQDSYNILSSAPVSNYISSNTAAPGRIYATGNAYDFGVSAASSAYSNNYPDRAFSESQVEAQWTFTAMNGIGRIVFITTSYINAWAEWGTYLVDVTTGQVMFNYRNGSQLRDYKYTQGAILWGADMPSSLGFIDLNFTANDMYSLYLFAHTNSNDDSASAFFNVSNIQPVPLPPTILLLGSSLVALWGASRKLKK